MSAQVQGFFHADTNTFSYLVSDPVSAQAAIIDPVMDFDARSGRTSTRSAQLLAEQVAAQELQVRWLFETHAHADHLSAAQWFKSLYPQARLAIGEGIRTVQRTFAPLFDLGPALATDGSQFDQLLADGETLTLGTLQVQVIAVPGHTSDSIALLIGDALFTGDSLFMPDGGTARCDFPGGDAATLYRSIQRLYELPNATRVFICHDYGPGGREVANETTIGEQRTRNIHVRDGIEEASFVAARSARDATLPAPNLLLPSLQVNLRAGALPEPAANGVRYLKLPLDQL